MVVFTYEHNGNCAEWYGPNAVKFPDVDYGQELWPIVGVLPGLAQEHPCMNTNGMLARNI